MSSERESHSHDESRARLQRRVAALSDDDRLREALRLYDEMVTLRAAFADVVPAAARPPGRTS